MLPLTPKDDSSEVVREALQFARETAKSEIDSIDRLHARTLKYLGAFATFLTLVGFGLSFIGYRNLHAFVATLVKEQVKHDIREQLQAANVDAIVRGILQQKTDEQIAELVTSKVGEKVGPEVNKQVADSVVIALRNQSAQINKSIKNEVIEEVGRQRATIRSAAVGEAQRITQEELSTPQTGSYTMVTNSLRQNPPAQVQVVYSPSDNTVGNLILAIKKAGWDVVRDPNSTATNGPSGILTIIDDPNQPSQAASRLRWHLKAARSKLGL